MTKSRLDEENLERIDHLVAIPPERDKARLAQTLTKAVERQLAEAGVLAEAATFLRSGWRIIESSAQVTGLPIYRSAAGRFYIVGNSMNVKFAPSTSEDEIKSVLELHHLEKMRSLGFAPNLMTVTSHQNASRDPLQISRSLSSHPAIEFVEPVVVEEIGGRG